MLRQLHQPGIRVCVSSYTYPTIVSVREKSRFRGKKDKNFDTVKWQHNNIPLQPHEDFEPNEWLPRRLTYYPDGLWSSLVPRPKPKWWVDRYKPLTIETLNPPEKEWNEEAIYPDIIADPVITHPYKTSYLGRTKWYKELAEIPSADEKNIALTKITRNVLHFPDPYFRFHGGLEAIQNLTRTHLIDGELPESYSTKDVDETLINRLTPIILDAIRVNKYQSSRAKNFQYPLGSSVSSEFWEERVKENNLLHEINNIIFSGLASSSPHLLDLQVDLESRVRSWWYASQLPLPPGKKETLWREKGYTKIDQLCTYDCVNPLQIRTSSPLPKIVSGSDVLSLSAEIPELNYHPIRFISDRRAARYLPSLPGFFHPRNFDPSTSDADDFPYLIMFGLQDLAYRRKVNYHQDFKDDDDIAKSKAILGSFGWLNGLSFYHGFTPFHEITYPFVNQGIVTDGQRYFFFVYQMNSHTYHSDIFEGDGPRNICWISPEIKLYESYQDGQFTGINKDVIKQLIKIYSMVPMKDPNVKYRPLISKDERSPIQIDENRQILGLRANGIHDFEMWSYKYARMSQLYHKLFVDNPDYNSMFMRIALRPRLKPAEDYYYQWKY